MTDPDPTIEPPRPRARKGRPPGPADLRRKSRTVRLSDAEYEYVEGAAARAGLGVMAYVRAVLLPAPAIVGEALGALHAGESTRRGAR